MSHGCLWISEVSDCASNSILIDENEEFSCPEGTAQGTFTKHAHPLDCRQFFLCIGGVPREQGCPLGEVFSSGRKSSFIIIIIIIRSLALLTNIILSGTGSGIDGFCTDPENVPECADYYAGNEEVLQQKSGPPANPGRVRTHRFY